MVKTTRVSSFFCDVISILFEIFTSPFCRSRGFKWRRFEQNICSEIQLSKEERGAGSPFTQNVPIFQFTIYTLTPLSQFSSKCHFAKYRRKYCCEGAKATPLPLKILTSNFGQTLNLYCLGHNNMEMDGMGSPNCSVVYIPSSLFNVLHFCTL